MGKSKKKSDKQRFTVEDLHQMMCSLNTHYWVQQNEMKLGGSQYQLKGHEYQVDVLMANDRRQCMIKGAQTGFSECMVLKTLHGMIYKKYNKGALYLFPTRDDVADFSKARFGPLIENNPCIKRHVKSTDSTNIKKINQAFLYLRGARATSTIGGSRKTSSQLKTIPVDRIVFDERDVMLDSMIELALERMSHSNVQEEIYLSTPTIPDFGVDRLYKESDQRVWMIKCSACQKETCLELEFPDCLKPRPDGSIYRACIHCGNEIYPAAGRWVAQYPDKSKDLVGWWVSQLNSIYVSPQKILDLYNDPPNGDLSEVMNSKLGMAYIAAENRLTRNDVYNCCSQNPMDTSHDGPTCAGVDVGKVLHVVIAIKNNENSIRVVKLARVESFNDLYDLFKRFNVRSSVIDLKPEIRKVREFQGVNRSFGVFACDYQERQRGMTMWDEKQGIVAVNRTEICDATHELVVQSGRLELPRKNSEITEYAKEMSSIAKVLDENEETGSKEYRYRKLGADHYRHATNYCLLASERVGRANDRNIISRYLNRRKRRTWMTA
jgi:hypothetical protein